MGYNGNLTRRKRRCRGGAGPARFGDVNYGARLRHVDEYWGRWARLAKKSTTPCPCVRCTAKRKRREARDAATPPPRRMVVMSRTRAARVQPKET